MNQTFADRSVLSNYEDRPDLVPFLANSNCIYLPELKIPQKQLFLAHYVCRGRRLVPVNCDLNIVVVKYCVEFDSFGQKIGLIQSIG